jgi:hypothetical protein
MGAFGHDVAKASAALFVLVAIVTSIKPFSYLATQATFTTASSLSMQASGRSAMLASGGSTSTAISEQAETHPECLSIFRFKPITNSSLARKQATLTAGKPLRLSSHTIQTDDCSLSPSLIQTAVKALTTTANTSCSFKSIVHSPIQIQIDDCSFSPSLFDDCSFSLSLFSQFQTELFQTEAPVDLPLRSTDTEAINDLTSPSSLTVVALAGPPR